MAACNLCHRIIGHTEKCPETIRVDWSTSRHVPGSIWETLARTLFDEFETAQTSSLVDRGSPEDEQKLDSFVRHCRQALEDGDPYTVIELFRSGRG